MNIEELWAQAKEEFGDEAYKRFNYMAVRIPRIETVWLNLNNTAIERMLRDDAYVVSIKPLSELIAHDIEFYGDNAHLMWEIKNRHMSGFVGVDSNIKLTSFCGEIRRKTRAAMPFDLDRANAGDAVEFNYNGEWIKCAVIDVEFDSSKGIKISFNGLPYFYDGENRTDRETVIFNFNELRMKYPSRIKSD